jgi:ABC-2 type transport system ATP-binding protein
MNSATGKSTASEIIEVKYGRDLVTASGLVKRFGQREAVSTVNLTVKSGEVFGLLGPNGAGKSTVIGMLSTYLDPDGGSIQINGIDVLKEPAKVKKIIGVVPQELAIYEEITAEENLNFFGEIMGLSRASRIARNKELLEAVGLWERRKEVVKKYSGGMKRRLNLICGLLGDPDFMMMDEPTIGIDPQSRQNVYDIIANLKSKGKAILYTTQYMEEAEHLCDRIAIIDNGRIIAQGTLEELLSMSEKKIVIEKPRGLSQLFLQLTGRDLRDS